MRTPVIKINLLPESCAERMLRVRSMGGSSSLRQNVSLFWRWSSNWEWFGTLAVAGGLVLDMGEYALATVFLSVATLGASSQLSQRKWTYFWKIPIFVLIVSVYALFFYDINEIRGGKPWTHIQPLIEIYITHKNGPLSDDEFQPPVLPTGLKAPKPPAIALEKTLPTTIHAKRSPDIKPKCAGSETPEMLANISDELLRLKAKSVHNCLFQQWHEVYRRDDGLLTRSYNQKIDKKAELMQKRKDLKARWVSDNKELLLEGAITRDELFKRFGPNDQDYLGLRSLIARFYDATDMEQSH